MFKINPMKSMLTLLIAVLMIFSLAGFAGATPLAADKAVITHTAGNELAFPIYTATKIYAGGLVMVNAAGYAIPGSDASGGIFVGIADATVDNTGASGAKSIVVMRRGLHLLTFGTAISQANVGDNIFITDDQTVDVAGNCTYDILVGNIAKYVSSTKAYVDIVPAIQQADVATHIADPSAAHAASAISFPDSGNKTAATEVDGALDEIYLDLLSIQNFIPVNIVSLRETSTMNVGNIAANGGLLASDTTPVLAAVNGATAGCQAVSWAASNNDEVMFAIPLPPDLDDTKDLIVHFRIKSAGTTNAVGFTLASYFNETGSAVADTSATNQTATWAEKIATIGAADVPAGAQTLTIGLTPVAHTTDIMYLSAIWIEYARVLRTE